MSMLVPLIYALLLRLVTAVRLEGFYFRHEEERMARAKVGEGARVDFLLPLTKSHHFRRLTSACDKCSTSSSLPISLELETSEASAACKIKNKKKDHLIHSSTKYISGEKKMGERQRQTESEGEHSLIYLAIQKAPQFLLNEALIQMDLCVANWLWHCRISQIPS